MMEVDEDDRLRRKKVPGHLQLAPPGRENERSGQG